MRIERVVLNASPIICLCKSGLSEILPALFSDIVVPAAVHKEVESKDDMAQASQKLFAHRQVKLQSDIIVPATVLAWDLGEGESAVLSLVLNHSEYWAIIDDREARKCALTLGCHYTGTVGVILLAKKRGVIVSVRDSLAKLQNAGLWLSEDFIKEVCMKAGE